MTKNLYCVLADDTHRDLKILAAKDGTTIKGWITESVEYAIKPDDDSPEHWRKIIKDTFNLEFNFSNQTMDAIIDQFQIEFKKYEMEKRGMETKK